MRRVTFETEIFRTKKDLPRGEAALKIFLNALFQIDCLFLRDYPAFPLLYTTGVRYKAEDPGLEEWRSCPVVLERGKGDCEDLACWRAAELRMREGIAAKPKVIRQPSQPGKRLYHIVVSLPNGRIEDPSKRLGMKGNA